MQHLGLATGAPHDHVAEVEHPLGGPEAQLLEHAPGQVAVAERAVERVDHDLGGEGARLGRQAADVLGGLAVEVVDRGVVDGQLGVGGGHGVVDLGVHRGHDLGRQQPLDDHGAVLGQQVADDRVIGVAGDPGR